MNIMLTRLCNQEPLTSKFYKLKLSRYEYMHMQHTEIFHDCKNDNFQSRSFDYFHIFFQKIDCEYTLEPTQRGGSNDYPQSMFYSKNKKIM